MTYKQLAAYIAVMTDEERNFHVALYDETNDEFIPLDSDSKIYFADENDSLKKGQPYLVF